MSHLLPLVRFIRLSVTLNLLIICVFISASISCSSEVDPLEAPEVQAFFNEVGLPPEPHPLDDIMRQKADVIVLPTISVSVWAIGAIIAYIGAHAVYTNSIEEFEYLLSEAFGGQTDWSWAESYSEPERQAEHLSTALNQVAYRSEESDFHSITGNDYLRILNMASPINVTDPQALRDLLDGKIRPFGQYAREYFAALQIASVQARHLSESEGSSEGLCVRATVNAIAPPQFPYQGVARAKNAVDVIPAAILASLKATVRCGMYDTDVREFIYSYYEVSGPRGQLVDIFISHTLKTAKLLFKYVDVCQLPPQIEVDLDGGKCFDVSLE